MNPSDPELDSTCIPPESEDSPRGRLLAYLSECMPTAWHIAAQHRLQIACAYIAKLVDYRAQRHLETTEVYAVALTRHLVVHRMYEIDGHLTQMRQLHMIH